MAILTSYFSETFVGSTHLLVGKKFKCSVEENPAGGGEIISYVPSRHPSEDFFLVQFYGAIGEIRLVSFTQMLKWAFGDR